MIYVCCVDSMAILTFYHSCHIVMRILGIKYKFYYIGELLWEVVPKLTVQNSWGNIWQMNYERWHFLNSAAGRGEGLAGVV